MNVVIQQTKKISGGNGTIVQLTYPVNEFIFIDPDSDGEHEGDEHESDYVGKNVFRVSGTHYPIILKYFYPFENSTTGITGWEMHTLVRYQSEKTFNAKELSSFDGSYQRWFGGGQVLMAILSEGVTIEYAEGVEVETADAYHAEVEQGDLNPEENISPDK